MPNGQQHGGRETGHGTDIRNEGQEARHDPDGDAKLQPCQMQSEGVENPKPEATQQLPAQPGGKNAVRIARDLPDHIRTAPRQPAFNARQHGGPISQQIKRDNRRHHHKGKNAE